MERRIDTKTDQQTYADGQAKDQYVPDHWIQEKLVLKKQTILHRVTVSCGNSKWPVDMLS